MALTIFNIRIMRAKDELFNLRSNVDKRTVSRVGELEAISPLLILERVNKLSQKCSSDPIRCNVFTVRDRTSSLAESSVLLLLGVGGPSREQVDAFEADLIGVLAHVLKQKSVELASHVIDCPR